MNVLMNYEENEMKLSTRVYRAVCAKLACTIEVTWEGQVFKHFAWSRAEAWDWARQYPISSTARVIDYKPYEG